MKWRIYKGRRREGEVLRDERKEGKRGEESYVFTSPQLPLYRT